MKDIIKYVIIFTILIVLFILILFITCSIPRKYIENNIIESSNILLNEGEVKPTFSFWKDTYVDNSTDAIMLNIAFSIDESDVFKSSMMARRNFLSKENVNSIVKDELGNLKYENSDQYKFCMTKELQDTLLGEKINVYEYSRYWHGYIAILKPLLIFFNVTQIRNIFQFILILGLILMLYFIYENTNFMTVLTTLLVFISVDVFTWAETLQGILVMLIAIWISVFVASKKIKRKNLNLILFIVGGVTVYLDFLTTPIVSFLLPVIVFNLVNYEKEISAKNYLINFIKDALSWGIGYFACWFMKWLLVDILYNEGIIKLAFEQMIFRIGFTDNRVPENVFFMGLLNNIVRSLSIVNILLLGIGYFLFLDKLAKKGIKYYINPQKIIYYIAGLVPIVWYLIIPGHSWQHFFFTYKNMLITYLCIAFILIDTNQTNKKED